MSGHIFAAAETGGRATNADLSGGNLTLIVIVGVIAVVALGMGATTTIFSAIQNILLDPFPYTDARRVAAIQIHDLSSARPGGRGAFQVPEFLDYQEQNHVFE